MRTRAAPVRVSTTSALAATMLFGVAMLGSDRAAGQGRNPDAALGDGPRDSAARPPHNGPRRQDDDTRRMQDPAIPPPRSDVPTPIHPLQLQYPQHDVVVCLAGCRTPTAGIIYISPKPAFARDEGTATASATGTHLPSSATSGQKSAAYEPAGIAVAVAGVGSGVFQPTVALAGAGKVVAGGPLAQADQTSCLAGCVELRQGSGRPRAAARSDGPSLFTADQGRRRPPVAHHSQGAESSSAMQRSTRRHASALRGEPPDLRARR